jgi:hypothetical protein
MQTKTAKVVIFQETTSGVDNEFEYVIELPSDLEARLIKLVLMGLLFDHDWCPGEEKFKMFFDNVEIMDE